MTLESLVALAASKQASDLHLEVSLRPTLRINGELAAVGEPVRNEELVQMVRTIVGHEGWEDFVHQRSFDSSTTISGVRCRINAMHTTRGVGLAVRLLPGLTPTIESLNLHPDVGKVVEHRHGLVLVSGATGSGKSSTLAALLQEINLTAARHIVTLEHPVEYRLRPVRSFIRQREVGHDTLSFEQGLMDALRQDPDVIMVGEMREPECMRLTLNAAETGHLVLATLHSATAAEALQRIVLAFPAEIQSGIAAQVADCLQTVICQRLRYHPDLGLQLPECEILQSTSASRSVIRQGEFSKLASVVETGAADGMFTWERYRRWVMGRAKWSRTIVAYEGSANDEPEVPVRHRAPPRQASRPPAPRPGDTPARHAPPPQAPPRESRERVFEIDVADDPAALISELVKKHD